MQTNDKLINFLQENGYSGLRHNPQLTDANWQIFKRGTSDVLCQCNDKPPQFHIERFVGEVNGHKYDYVKFNIWGETNLKNSEDSGIWFNGDMSFDVDYVIDNLAMIEERCNKIWEASNGV